MYLLTSYISNQLKILIAHIANQDLKLYMDLFPPIWQILRPLPYTQTFHHTLPEQHEHPLCQIDYKILYHAHTSVTTILQ